MDTERSSERLTHAFAKSINRPGRYGDGRGGHGLSLLVKKAKNGRWSKTWAQRLRTAIGRKPTARGLGSFPTVTLAMARDKALDNVQRVARGEDILKPKPVIPTVNEAFDAVFSNRADSWTSDTTKQYWYLTKKYAQPIGSKPVSEVTRSNILNLIKPLWYTHPRLARALRQNLSRVMKWAIFEDLRDNDPAGPEVAANLGRQPAGGHQKSLPFNDLGNALAQVRDSNAWWAIKHCLIFIALTGVRSKEARMATWDEINLDTDTWTIPGSRMKNRTQHQVPLSSQAKEILAHAQQQTGRRQGLIFPPELRGKFISSGSLSNLMRELKIPAVPHGSRSSFRNWAGGNRDILSYAAEMVLAHKPSEPIVKIYLTSDFFEHRQPVMQEWADFLTSSMGPVISTIPDVSREEQRERRANSRLGTFNMDPIGEDEYRLIIKALREPETRDIWDVPDEHTLRRALVIAAIGLMRDGLLRPKETAEALWSHLKKEADGSGLLNIRSSKKNRAGTDHVAYVSPRTMRALDETRRLRKELKMVATDGRILQMKEYSIPKHIKKACRDAGLTGTFTGFSPRNGMAKDLTSSGVGVNELKMAKGWRLMGMTNDDERENLARNGPVAQWYAQKKED